MSDADKILKALDGVENHLTIIFFLLVVTIFANVVGRK